MHLPGRCAACAKGLQCAATYVVGDRFREDAAAAVVGADKKQFHRVPIYGLTHVRSATAGLRIRRWQRVALGGVLEDLQRPGGHMGFNW